MPGFNDLPKKQKDVLAYAFFRSGKKVFGPNRSGSIHSFVIPAPQVPGLVAEAHKNTLKTALENAEKKGLVEFGNEIPFHESGKRKFGGPVEIVKTYGIKIEHVMPFVKYAEEHGSRLVKQYGLKNRRK